MEMRKIVSFLRMGKASGSPQRMEQLARKINSTYGLKLELSQLPADGKWKRWIHHTRVRVSGLKNKLHARHRTKARIEASKHSRMMESARCKSRDKGNFYNFVRATQKAGKPAKAIATRDSSGNLQMHFGKEVLVQEQIYLPVHMGGAQRPYYQDKQLGSTQQQRNAGARGPRGRGGRGGANPPQDPRTRPPSCNAIHTSSRNLAVSGPL
jgi:hypothetical protein